MGDTAKGVLTLRPSPTTDTSEAMAAMAMVDTASAMVVSTGATTARGAPTLSLRPRLMPSPTMAMLAAMSLTLPEPSISPRGRQRLTLTTDTDMVDTDMAVDMAMAAMAMAVDITGVRQGHPTSSPKTPMAFCLLSGLGNSSYDSRAHMFDCFRMQYKPKLEPVDPAKR